MCRRRRSRLGFSIVAALTAVVAAHTTSTPGLPQGPATDPRCVWNPPETAITRTARNMGELRRRVEEAKPGTTILLEDGEYRLDRMLDIATERVVIRGRSGDRGKVIVRGDGMQEPHVGVALSISASHVTLADLTVGYVRFHGVQVRGERGASHLVMQNIRVVNTGQQLIKGSVGADGHGPDDGLLACSRIEYTDHAPSDYTDGIDVLSGRGWIVRDNTFSRIRGPENRRNAGPAILFWANSQNTIVERNLIVDSSRGIAFGLGPVNGTARDGERYFDHQGGRIRNNVVWNLNSWGDEGIEANAARDLSIDHNTVLVEGQLPWSISIRFPLTSVKVRNNLTNRTIILRDGGQADQQGNLATATRPWFVDAAAADLHLAGPTVPAVGAAVPLADVVDDFDKSPRDPDTPDVGAFELQPSRNP